MYPSSASGENRIDPWVVIFLLVALMVFAARVSFAQPDRITFTTPHLYPEGIAYNTKNKSFYVSSVKTGTIGTVDQNGNYVEFYKDSSLKSSFGMKIDEKNNLLWVCISDPNYSVYSDSVTFKKMARVIAIDLVSKIKIHDIDLGKLKSGKHFTNDLVSDGKGNFYVTDSFSPHIYKINKKGNAAVFATNELFSSPSVGLNGIVYHSSGYLLVVNKATGVIVKVSINNPERVSKVNLNTPLIGADGLLLDKENLIVVVNKGIDKVFQLTTKDNWTSAEISASTSPEDHFQNPTTATHLKENIYVLNSKLNELSDSTKLPSSEFSIQKVMFKPIN